MERLRFLSCIVILPLLFGDAIAGEFDALSDELLAERYRELRFVSGHFSGASWNRDVDAWNGPKHRIMKALAERLGERSRVRLERLMGAPDLISRTGDVWYRRLSRDLRNGAGAETFWIYYWRGQRDFLYFAIDRERVAYSDWWYSYE